MSLTGIKHDSRKPRWSLLPSGVIEQVVCVLEIGASKYLPNNWQHLPDARVRYYDALMRHVQAWWSGERLDPETHSHHLAHAACCIFFLLWLDERSTASDHHHRDPS